MDRVEAEVRSGVRKGVVPALPRLRLSPAPLAHLELVQIAVDLRDVLVRHVALQEAQRHVAQREVLPDVPLVPFLLLRRVHQRQVARRRRHEVDDRLGLTPPRRTHVAQLQQHLRQLDLVPPPAVAARVLVQQLAEQRRQLVAHRRERPTRARRRAPSLPHRRHAHHARRPHRVRHARDAAPGVGVAGGAGGAGSAGSAGSANGANGGGSGGETRGDPPRTRAGGARLGVQLGDRLGSAGGAVVLGAVLDELQRRGADEVAALRAGEVVLGVVLLQLLVGAEELGVRCGVRDYHRRVVHAADEAMDVLFAAMRQQGLRTVLHLPTNAALLSITHRTISYDVHRLARIGKDAVHMGLQFLRMNGRTRNNLTTVHAQLSREHALALGTDGANAFVVLLQQMLIQTVGIVEVLNIVPQEISFVLAGERDDGVADCAAVRQQIQKPLLERFGVKVDGVVPIELKSVFVDQRRVGLVRHHCKNGRLQCLLRDQPNRTHFTLHMGQRRLFINTISLNMQVAHTLLCPHGRTANTSIRVKHTSQSIATK